MPSSNTKTIANSVTWAQHFLGRRPFYFGTDLEPALTTTNTIIQTMLQPPFKWRWNRASKSFGVTTAGGGQDVTVSIPDFGFIEKAQVSAGTGPNAGKAIEIPRLCTELSQDGGQGRFNSIAAY